MSDGILHRYFLNNGHKRLHKWVHYFDIYERHFSRFRDKNPVMLEIGVHGGGSLSMWKNYFGLDSKIIGIDINPECKKHEAEGIHVFIGSQDDPELINNIFNLYPNIDIILDDGSHKMEHMIASFELMYDRLSSNGIYMVEDVHTSYWSNFGGGLKKEGSFMEFVKDKLDELNAAHTKGVIPISKFTQTTDSVVCYDSVVVFERRIQGRRQAPITDKMES